MVASMVGTLSSELFPSTSASTASSSEGMNANAWGTSSTVSVVAAASQVTPNAYASSGATSLNATMSGSAGMTSASSLSASSPLGVQGSNLSAAQASSLARSISKETVSKVQQSLRNRHDESKHR
jgi:hypothetical protein